ncbi:MAG: hypothetical protein ABSD98_15485 [Candidatus Korobacteraceae bacterium]|jgi:hypothetical protein
MNARQYKTELKEAEMGLVKLYEKRQLLEIEIAKQQQRISALAVLSGEEEKTFESMALGLTAACRAAFRAAGPRGLMPTELRDSLRRMGFQVDKYSNAMASIHAVIKRLEAKGEIRNRIHDKREGVDSSVYQWTLKSWGSPRSLANMLTDFERDKADKRRK